MASFRSFGPFRFDFGPNGLAPGSSTPTFWDLTPQLDAGTVSFTAIPDITPGTDGARLAVRDPTVHVEAGPVGGSTNVTLHVVVANVGQNTVRNANMYISYVVP
jgi:hypothetical protein